MLTLSTFLISGCSSVKQLEIFSTEVEREPLNLLDPIPPAISNLDWNVITKENFKKVLDDLKKSGSDPVLFGLTDEGYEILAKNFAQIRAYILKQKLIIKQYRDYYEPPKIKK